MLIAMKALRSNQNFSVVTEFLLYCLQRTHAEGSVTHDEIKARWMQGGAQDLTELLSLIKQSEDLS